MKYQISKKHVQFSYYYNLFFIGVLSFFVFFSVNVAHAVTPTLSVSATGDGDSVKLNVTGDSNSNVLLFYIKTSVSQQQIISIGNTNSSGTLTTTISSSQYGIVSGSSVRVAIGNINGAQSSSVLWPAVSSLISSSNMLSLSQTGLVLPIGQSSTITASNLGSSSIYLSSNSNPMIANVNLSGSQVTVLANSYGSTVASICLINNSSNCSSVYITVQNSSAQPLTFSQSSVSISSGQSIAIQVSGGSGSYFVSNNSTQNQGVIQTSISGSTVTLTTSSTSGSSSITICSTDNSSCGIINVTIGTTSSSAISFSQSSPTVVIGQNVNISVYGPSSSLLYVSSNSNPSIVQANLSGTTLTLLGITNGTSTISVCAATNNCGSLTVTVNYNYGNSGSVYPSLSQSSVILSVGQTLNVTISGGSMPYNIISSTNNIFQPTLNVNTLTLYGAGLGSGAMNVCSSGGSCATLSVTVKESSTSTLPAGCLSVGGYSQTTGVPCSTTSVTTVNSTLPVGCTSTTSFSSITGQSCNYNVNNTTVDNSNSSYTAPINSVFKFTKAIKLGSTGTEVMELQKKLKTLGFYKGKIDEGFGAILEKAVKAFQKKNKLPQAGNVGPSTRALLNK